MTLQRRAILAGALALPTVRRAFAETPEVADRGVLKRRPANLADLFFPEAAELGGS